MWRESRAHLVGTKYETYNKGDAMTEFVEGGVIGVRCEVMPGPFSGERMITFNAVYGSVSGFVRDNELREESGQWHVRAVIETVEDDQLSVWIRGSFFTTNGTATISRHEALAA